MALLRLALVSLAACGQAGAQPSATSGLAAPAGWRALPELASAIVDAAKTDGVTVDGAEGWGETSRGCYGIWLALHGSGATADAVLAGLATEKLAVSDVVKPDGDGVVSATFAKPPFSGRLRARLADGKLTALACFANAREPKSCDAGCTTLLGGVP
jgi:hypothetical protein